MEGYIYQVHVSKVHVVSMIAGLKMDGILKLRGLNCKDNCIHTMYIHVLHNTVDNLY